VGGLAKEAIHREVCDALGDAVESHGPIADVPFKLKAKGVVPLAIWAYTVTSPPGGRHPLESKIQLIAPGQARDARGNFVPPDEVSFSILLGFKPEERLFVLWDAYKHVDFAYSKNAQVRAEPLVDALSFGTGRTTRKLQGGEEAIIAARPDHLLQALTERIAT
jgi:hypothetical protein